MCQNWNVQVANLLEAEQPTVDGLMTAAGVSPETEKTVDAAYLAAESAVAGYKPGGDIDAIQQALTAVVDVTEALGPVIPPAAETILVVVIAGVKGALAIVAANTKTAPAAQKALMAKALTATTTAVPSFKLNEFELLRAHVDPHVAARHYRKELNKAVDAAGPEFEHLRQ